MVQKIRENIGMRDEDLDGRSTQGQNTAATAQTLSANSQVRRKTSALRLGLEKVIWCQQG